MEQSTLELFLEKVRIAMKFPYSLDDVNAQQEAEKNLRIQFLSGFINQEQFWIKLQQIQSQLPPLICSTLEEFRIVLRYIGCNPEDTIRIASDILWDYQRANLYNIPKRFILQFYRVNKGIAFYVAVQIHIGNETLSDKQLRQFLVN